jgi:hypothetical protein
LAFQIVHRFQTRFELNGFSESPELSGARSALAATHSPGHGSNLEV